MHFHMARKTDGGHHSSMGIGTFRDSAQILTSLTDMTETHIRPLINTRRSLSALNGHSWGISAQSRANVIHNITVMAVKNQ